MKFFYNVTEEALEISEIPTLNGPIELKLSKESMKKILNLIPLAILDNYIEDRKEEAIKATEISYDINHNINKIMDKVSAEVKNNDTGELERIFSWILEASDNICNSRKW